VIAAELKTRLIKRLVVAKFRSYGDALLARVQVQVFSRGRQFQQLLFRRDRCLPGRFAVRTRPRWRSSSRRINSIKTRIRSQVYLAPTHQANGRSVKSDSGKETKETRTRAKLKNSVMLPKDRELVPNSD
jgi:hypothetical protein